MIFKKNVRTRISETRFSEIFPIKVKKKRLEKKYY